jgi:hypothetical protein
VTLNADSALAHLMKTKGITWVVVGADCIAANGDVANKIGTYQLAVSAMHHGVRFMVVAPSTSIDLNLATGEDIPLEERDADECWKSAGPGGTGCRGLQPGVRCDPGRPDRRDRDRKRHRRAPGYRQAGPVDVPQAPALMTGLRRGAIKGMLLPHLPTAPAFVITSGSFKAAHHGGLHCADPWHNSLICRKSSHPYALRRRASFVP